LNFPFIRSEYVPFIPVCQNNSMGAITRACLTPEDLAQVDPRILKFISGWKVVEQWEGKDVIIPDYTPINYFEALNKPEGIQDDEKQLTLWCGWAGRSKGIDIDGQYDAEVIITLSVNGTDCHDPTIQRVNVEVIKSGGTSIQVYFNDHLVTNFMDTIPIPEIDIPGNWFCPGKTIPASTIQVNNGYQTVQDIYKLL